MHSLFRSLAFASLLSGCALQLAEPLVSAPRGTSPSPVDEFSSNEIDNNLTISKMNAYPWVVATGSSSLLTVDYVDALGRPVGVTWSCDRGVLLSNKGAKTQWIAPPEASSGQSCECEATVRSRSGMVKATLTLVIK